MDRRSPGKDNATEIKRFEYTLNPIEKGYNNKTLYINISDNTIMSKPVTDEMKKTFTGGRGFGLWLLWNAKKGKIKWNEPDNEICIACGPLGGTTLFPGSGKSIVVTVSPETGSIIDSNVGGYFGPYLKFAGWDALEIQGKAEKDIAIVIDGDNGIVSIEDAEGLPRDSHLLGAALGKKYSEGNLKAISSVSAGSGAEHTLIGCLNFSWFDNARKSFHYKQAGRGGTGTVFRDKNIKAVVVKFSHMSADINHPDDFERLKNTGRAYTKEVRTLDPKQNEMGTIGTSHLVTIMNDYDLLPTNNYKFGNHLEAPNLGKEVFRKKFDPGFDGCWMGCAVACSHTVKGFTLKTGCYKDQVVWVDGPEYETIAGCGSNWGIFDPDFVIEVNFYCDTYGLDTISVATSMAFAMECYEMGIIDKKVTGGLDLRFGNKEAALEALHQMSEGEGFGSIVGQGIRKMKDILAREHGANPEILQDIGMESKGLEFSEYITKESLAQQGGYGLALKGPQHDEAWLIFVDMVNNFMPTFEQKAEALYWFPMWRTWFGLNGLCKLPWNDIVPEDNKSTLEPAKVMKHVEWYVDYFSAVTGINVNPDELIKMSEKVYNFQRIFNLRQGFGRREHDNIPYRAMGPVTEEEYESRIDRYDGQLEELNILTPEGKNTGEKLRALRKYREDRYEKLKDAAYKRRGWTHDGVPTVEKAKELGIDFPDVIDLISQHQ
ncbi:MAG: aldehyde ferredoxin oxidoreductase C-terminal domain-containing protein [Thermodesulfobacteriota bacterium]|nr:aldehyde ferredoxin oxidoreductase C-terminal domain-containing protein [Thermodesulfobacteriota bacterium]